MPITPEEIYDYTDDNIRLINTENGVTRGAVASSIDMSVEYTEQEVDRLDGRIDGIASNYTEVVISVSRDAGSGNYTVTDVYNGFDGVTFSCADQSTNKVRITASSNIFSNGKTLCEPKPIYLASGVAWALSGGNFLTPSFIDFEFVKIEDGASGRPTGFIVPVTIKIYN